jgi:hypothetical protein
VYIELVFFIKSPLKMIRLLTIGVLIISNLSICNKTKPPNCPDQIKTIVENHWKPVDFGSWNPETMLKKDDHLNKFLVDQFSACLSGMPKSEVIQYFGKDGRRENISLEYLLVDTDDTYPDSILCINFWFDKSARLKNITFETGCVTSVD